MTADERFLAKVDKVGGHWLWMGSTTENGYGQFHFEGRTQKAHRVSYRLFVGPIPEGLNVLHRCDIRHCVRPRCLFLGSQLDNLRDASKKGRLGKLTNDQVDEVRRRYSLGEAPKTLAREFGVCQVTIYNKVRGDVKLTPTLHQLLREVAK